jgi:hypothetical protein
MDIHYSAGSTDVVRNKDSQYGEELARWLRTFQWTLWGTFTFSYPASTAAARRAMERFIKYLRKSTPVDYVAVVERGDHGSHVHALLGGIPPEKSRTIQAAWHNKYGLAKVRPYSTCGGAAGYITKYMHHENTEWWIDFPV